jgi:hypothetical protein
MRACKLMYRNLTCCLATQLLQTRLPFFFSCAALNADSARSHTHTLHCFSDDTPTGWTGADGFSCGCTSSFVVCTCVVDFDASMSTAGGDGSDATSVDALILLMVPVMRMLARGELRQC